jgi:hypothetical protein
MNVVPPKSRSYTVFGRPKTRTAARFSSAFAVFAVISSFLHTDQVPVLLLLAAAVTACVALVLLVIERPRHFTEYRPSPPPGTVIHLTDNKSRLIRELRPRRITPG